MRKTKKETIEQRAGIIEKHGLLILLGLLAAVIGIVFFDFIMFNKLYLFKGLASDSMVATYPNYILVSDYLRTEGIPKWSFSQGLGQSIFPFSFPDPFVTFLYALGRDNLAYGLAYMEILKIMLSGVVFYFFLKKRALSATACIVGGLTYAFSSFMVVGSCWNLFSTEVLYLALLLLAFEKLYQDGSWTLFPIVIALIAILQPFDLWLFGVFLFIYVLVRHFEEDEPQTKKLVHTLLQMGLLACLGIGISSFFFLSEVRAMVNSPRVVGDAGYFDTLLSNSVFSFGNELHNITAIMRLFTSELLGGSNTFQGWNNFMEAPLFYCGLINLLLFPQVFPFLDKRKRMLYALWMAFFVLPVLFPFLRYAFWLFSGDYYRVYSFFVAFILIFFGARSLHLILEKGKVNLRLLVATLAVLLVIIYFPYDYLKQHDILNKELRGQIAIFLFGFTCLIALLRFKQLNRYMQLGLLFLVFVEFAYFTSNNVKERWALTGEEHREKFGFLDYTIDAISYLKKTDSSFYRVSKDYWSGPVNHPSFNDAKIQGYKGTGSYHSFNQQYYVRFLAGMNIIDEEDEDQTRWIVGLRNDPFLHSHVSVKYFLSKSPTPLIHVNYDSLTTIGDVRIYKNKFVLPLGFTYDRFIERKDFMRLPPEQKEIMLYKAFVFNDSVYKGYLGDFPAYAEVDTSADYPFQEYVDDLNHLRDDTLAISTFSNNYIKGTIALEEQKMLFFSIPYSEGWSAFVDGKEQQLIRINLGFLGLLLDKGSHTVELRNTPPLFYLGAVISVVSLLVFVALIMLLRRRKAADLAAQ